MLSSVNTQQSQHGNTVGNRAILIFTDHVNMEGNKIGRLNESVSTLTNELPDLSPWFVSQMVSWTQLSEDIKVKVKS